LVAEAVGRRFANKPSSCYTVLKANVDALVAYLSSDEEDQRNSNRSTPKIVHNPMLITANKQVERKKRKYLTSSFHN